MLFHASLLKISMPRNLTDWVSPWCMSAPSSRASRAYGNSPFVLRSVVKSSPLINQKSLKFDTENPWNVKWLHCNIMCDILAVFRHVESF